MDNLTYFVIRFSKLFGDSCFIEKMSDKNTCSSQGTIFKAQLALVHAAAYSSRLSKMTKNGLVKAKERVAVHNRHDKIRVRSLGGFSSLRH